MNELRQARDAGTITPEQHAELNQHLETALTTADVGGEHIPGLLNQVGRAQLEQSGKMKPFRVKTDLDDFKGLNDTFGHAVGDDVLRLKAEAMREAFGPGNAWREGGDEFGAHADTPEAAQAAMEKVREKLAGAKIEGVDANGNPITARPLGVSYGVGKGETPRAAAKAADDALYADKTARKASGQRTGRRETDAAVLEGMGSGSEGKGRSDVPPREAQVAVAERPEPKAAPTEAPPKASPEVAAPEQRDTSVRNAATAVDRATLGMEPLPEAEHKGWDKSKEEAAQRMEDNPLYAQTLAREVLKSKRAISDSETMALGAERYHLQEQHASTVKEIARAVEAGDKVAETQARVQKARIEDELDINHNATQKGGTELARAMAARNAQFTADYSAAHMLTRARAAYRGKVPAEVEGRLADIAKKIDEQERKIQDDQSAAQVKAEKEQARLQKQIDEMEAKLAKRIKVCPI
jgi:diguanylate cyclase (GGDEF)-like protein